MLPYDPLAKSKPQHSFSYLEIVGVLLVFIALGWALYRLLNNLPGVLACFT